MAGEGFVHSGLIIRDGRHARFSHLMLVQAREVTGEWQSRSWGISGDSFPRSQARTTGSGTPESSLSFLTAALPLFLSPTGRLSLGAPHF